MRIHLSTSRFVYVLFLSAIVGLLSSLTSLILYYVVDFYLEFKAELVLIEHSVFSYKLDRGLIIGVVITCLSIITGFVLVYKFPKIRGAGADDALQAYHLYDARISLRDLFLKAIVTILFIGGGAPVGLFGPIVFIGGGIGALFANISGSTFQLRRRLFLSGVAASLASIFKSPFGAAIYALELPYRRDLETQAFLSVIVASIVGYSVSSMFNPGFFINSGLMGSSPYDLLSVILVVLYAVLIGLISRIYSRIYSFAREKLLSTHRFYLIVLIYTITLSILLIVLPYSLGPGFNLVELLSSRRPIVNYYFVVLIVSILVVKIVLAPLIIGSGGCGGLFAPALISGFLLGYILYLPLYSILGDKYYLLALITGMAVFYGGISTTPIGTAVMIAEMTGNYSYIPLLLLATIISREVIGRDYLYKYQRNRRLLPVIQKLRDLYEEIISKNQLFSNIRLRRYRSYMIEPMIYNYDEYCKEPFKIYSLLGLPYRDYIVVIKDKRVLGIVSYHILLDVLKNGCITESFIYADQNDHLGRIVRLITRYNIRFIIVKTGNGIRVLEVEKLYKALMLDALKEGLL